MAIDPKVADTANKTAQVGKKDARGYNPIKWVMAMNLRTQILLFVGIIIVLLVISARSEKTPTANMAPTNKGSSDAASSNSGAPGAQAKAEDGKPSDQRFPKMTPSDEEIKKLAEKRTRGVDNPADILDRGVPDPLTGSEGNRIRAEMGRHETKSAPATGKHPVPVEVMGGFGPPPAADTSSQRTASVSSPSSAVAAQAGGREKLGLGASNELKVFAPFGRPIKCKLINTIDSLSPDNAVIAGMVMQDLEFNGHVIIPATTEVYGYIVGKPKLDSKGVGRMFDSGHWILVLPKQPGGKNGRELDLKGRVLDRREIAWNADGTPTAWALDDAAPGLIGYTISTLDNEEIKQFAAAFMSSAAQAAANISQTQRPAAGLAGALGAMEIAPTAKNAGIGALGEGTSAAFKAITDRISEEIKDRGYYVRVNAGKEFYLFVEQTLDPEQAKVGLHRDGVESLGK